LAFPSNFESIPRYGAVFFPWTLLPETPSASFRGDTRCLLSPRGLSFSDGRVVVAPSCPNMALPFPFSFFGSLTSCSAQISCRPLLKKVCGIGDHCRTIPGEGFSLFQDFPFPGGSPETKISFLFSFLACFFQAPGSFFSFIWPPCRSFLVVFFLVARFLHVVSAGLLTQLFLQVPCFLALFSCCRGSYVGFELFRLSRAFFLKENFGLDHTLPPPHGFSPHHCVLNDPAVLPAHRPSTFFLTQVAFPSRASFSGSEALPKEKFFGAPPPSRAPLGPYPWPPPPPGSAALQRLFSPFGQFEVSFQFLSAFSEAPFCVRFPLLPDGSSLFSHLAAVSPLLPIVAEVDVPPMAGLPPAVVFFFVPPFRWSTRHVRNTFLKSSLGLWAPPLWVSRPRYPDSFFEDVSCAAGRGFDLSFH